jgi:hypothetical protein
MTVRSTELVEETTQDGYRIVREAQPDLLLGMYYAAYNQACFDGSLPDMPIFWAKVICSPKGNHPVGLYVPEEDAVIKRRYIVVDERLSSMFPLERLILLHEMVHVKLGPDIGHGEEFIAEFKRVLDATRWEEMGCIDSPDLQAQK